MLRIVPDTKCSFLLLLFFLVMGKGGMVGAGRRGRLQRVLCGLGIWWVMLSLGVYAGDQASACLQCLQGVARGRGSQQEEGEEGVAGAVS